MAVAIAFGVESTHLLYVPTKDNKIVDQITKDKVVYKAGCEVRRTPDSLEGCEKLLEAWCFGIYRESSAIAIAVAEELVTSLDPQNGILNGILFGNDYSLKALFTNLMYRGSLVIGSATGFNETGLLNPPTYTVNRPEYAACYGGIYNLIDNR